MAHFLERDATPFVLDYFSTAIDLQNQYAPETPFVGLTLKQALRYVIILV